MLMDYEMETESQKRSIHEIIFNQLPLSNKQKEELLDHLREHRHEKPTAYSSEEKIDVSMCECKVDELDAEKQVTKPLPCLKCFIEHEKNIIDDHGIYRTA